MTSTYSCERTRLNSYYQQHSNVTQISDNNHITSTTTDSLFIPSSSVFNESKNTNYCTTFRLSIALIISLLIIIIFLFIHISSISSSADSLALLNTYKVSSAMHQNIDCKANDYFTKIVKEQWTVAFGGIIEEQHGVTRYEASGITYDSKRKVYWVVFDSLFALGKLSPSLLRSTSNILVASAVDGYGSTEADVEAGYDYEGIAYDAISDNLFLLSEAIPFNYGNEKVSEMKNTNNRHSVEDSIVYYSVIRQVQIVEKQKWKWDFIKEGTIMEPYNVLSTCLVNFKFENDRKGFEALVIVVIDDIQYFIAMCEGNFCSAGERSRIPGNGRLVLIDFRKKTDINDILKKYPFVKNTNIDCLYEHMSIFDIPPNVKFKDYAALSVQSTMIKNEYKFAIGSQENAAVWMGNVKLSLKTFVFEEGKVLWYPKNDACETIFCNVEGIAWMNDSTIIAVSDKAKSDGLQPYVCKTKDQSVHIFQAQSL